MTVPTYRTIPKDHLPRLAKAGKDYTGNYLGYPIEIHRYAPQGEWMAHAEIGGWHGPYPTRKRALEAVVRFIRQWEHLSPL